MSGLSLLIESMIANLKHRGECIMSTVEDTVVFHTEGRDGLEGGMYYGRSQQKLDGGNLSLGVGNPRFPTLCMKHCCLQFIVNYRINFI